MYVDDDVFPTPSLATGWKSSYVPDSITAVRGLVRDQRDSSDTSADVGRYFRDRLKAYGITAAGYYGRTDAAPTAPVLASSQGAPLSTTVNRMLLVSDNEIAESLHKLVGVAKGKGSTWTGARSAQALVLGQQGLSAAALYDGSGLSRADRISAVQLARVVDRGVDTSHPELWPLRSAEGMPTGRSHRHAVGVLEALRHGAVQVRRREAVGQDGPALRRRRALRLHQGRRRPGQGLRLRRQRQGLDDDAQAERRHARRDGHRLLLTPARALPRERPAVEAFAGDRTVTYYAARGDGPPVGTRPPPHGRPFLERRDP